MARWATKPASGYPPAILDTREKQAIQSGIYHPVSREVPHLQPICSSGECQWRNFSSLAVCAAVADITDRLTITNQTRPARLVGPGGSSSTNEPLLHASLPNGLYLLGSTSTYNLNISWPRGNSNNAGLGSQQQQQGEESFLPSRTSLAFSDQDGRVSSAIANFFLVYTNQTGELPALGSQQEGVFRAAEVLFHFCVNTYQVSTSRGVSTSRVVHSSTITAQGEPASIRRGDGEEDRREEAGVFRLRSRQADPVAGVYSVRRDDVRLLNGYLLSLFTGTYSYRFGAAAGAETPTSEALGAAMFRREVGGEIGSEEELGDVVRNLTSNVAIGLSNA